MESHAGDETPRGVARLRTLAGWFDASPAELVGLGALLVSGALAAFAFWWAGTPRPAETDRIPVPTAEASVATPVTVHVSGAVARAGVVRLPAGARVDDAIRAAGGVLLSADLDALNLARELVDGEQVVVPRRAPEGEQPADGGPTASAWRADGRLDLNLATAGDLQQLPGVGPVLAERIVAWRTANGGFTQVGDLREVRGIGPRTFEALADLVVVGP